jgi:hypothetical protein
MEETLRPILKRNEAFTLPNLEHDDPTSSRGNKTNSPQYIQHECQAKSAPSTTSS